MASLAGLALIVVVTGGCRRQVVAPVAAPGAIVQARTFVDLLPGWRLTTVTPMRRDGAAGVWKYGQPNVKTSQTDGLNVRITLDAEMQFGFERTEYAVGERGLVWQRSVRTLEGVEQVAGGPVLELFEKPGRKQLLRLLFLTRASDQNYNTALLRARDLKAMDAWMGVVRANPDAACKAPECVWMPPGVAARPEKPGANGFVPVL